MTQPLFQVLKLADFLLSIPVSRYWGKAEYFGDYPVPSQEVCRYALESGKKGLGFDTIGIDPIADEGLTRHRLLLSQRDIVIIETSRIWMKSGGSVSLCSLALEV